MQPANFESQRTQRIRRPPPAAKIERKRTINITGNEDQMKKIEEMIKKMEDEKN